MVHPLGLGFLWNLPSYGVVDLGNSTPGVHNWTSFATQNLDFWIVTTPAEPDAVVTFPPVPIDPASTSPLAQLLSSYVEAVGHAAPMPDYVAGVHNRCTMRMLCFIDCVLNATYKRLTVIVLCSDELLLQCHTHSRVLQNCNPASTGSTK